MTNDSFPTFDHRPTMQGRQRRGYRQRDRVRDLEGACMRSHAHVAPPGHPDLATPDDSTHSEHTLPVLLTVDETANLLRTTRRGIYAMVERGQLPGVIRIRRRVLVRTIVLLHWLDQKRAPSLKE